MWIDRFLFSRELQPDEEMIYVIHRHWVLVYKQFTKVALLGLLFPLAGLVFLTGFATQLSVIFYVWFVVGWLIMAYDFFDWYGDAWVLTSTRIIDVKWDGFFKHSGITLDFYNMMDVEYDVRGIRQKIWKYGTLSINKFSASPIEVQCVNRPKEAANMISSLRTKYMNEHKGRADEVANVLAELVKDRMDRDRQFIDDDDRRSEERYG